MMSTTVPDSGLTQLQIKDISSAIGGDKLREILLESEKIHLDLKNIRLRIIRQMQFSGTTNEIAIKEAIRCKLISASKLKPILAGSRHKLVFAAKINKGDDAAIATLASNKLQGMVNYIPDHLVFAILALEKLAPEYETFKNTPVDFEQDPELTDIMSNLDSEEKNYLLKMLKTTRQLILNYSDGYFALETTIEQIRIQENYSIETINQWQFEMVNKLIELTEEDGVFLNSAFTMTSSAKMEHGVTRKLIADPTFDFHNPSTFYTATLQSIDIGAILTSELPELRLFPIETGASNNLPLLQTTADTTAETKKLLRLQTKNKQLTSQVANLNAARDRSITEALLVQQRRKNAKINKESSPKKTKADIYVSGSLKDLKEVKSQLSVKDLFLAAKAGNRKLVKELQNIRGISVKINTLFIVKSNDVIEEAKEDETNAKNALQVAAKNNHVGVVKVLANNAHIKLSEALAEKLLGLENIDQAIKKAINAILERQRRSNIKPTTALLSSPTVTPKPVVEETKIADPVEIAKKYFQLIADNKASSDASDLITKIEGLFTSLNNKIATGSDFESFMMSQQFKFKSAKTKYVSNRIEADKIVAEFATTGLSSLRKTHLGIARTIVAAKKELTEVFTALETKLAEIEAKEEKKQAAAPATPRSQPSSLLSAPTTLFAPTVDDISSYQGYKQEFISKMIAFAEFKIDETFDQATRVVTMDLQIHAILFEIMQLMEKRKNLHAQLCKDPIPQYSRKLHLALAHTKGFLDESLSPDSLEILLKTVICFARLLVGAINTDSFTAVFEDSYSNMLLAHGNHLDEEKEEVSDSDSLAYTFSTAKQNLLFSTYSHPLPTHMQLSALCMVNTKALAYDGFDLSLAHLETMCKAPLYSQRRYTP
jgi:hypothetical protein